jgi:hypothetical protein
MEQQTLTFNVDAIFEPASKGIARAYVFVGFAVNAANDPSLTSFHLPGKGQMRFVPDAPSHEVVESYKQEFMNWVVANALRETVEAFGSTLDRLFEACLIADYAVNRRTDSYLPALNEFGHAGISGKLKRLHQAYGIKSGVSDEFHSLNQARNCLSHRRGMVAIEDCTDEAKTKLVVNLWGWRMFVSQPDGSQIDVDEEKLNSGGVVVKDGGQLAMQLVVRQLEFPIGSLLKLQPRDLTDVFTTFWTAGQNLKLAFQQFIQSSNPAGAPSAPHD